MCRRSLRLRLLVALSAVSVPATLRATDRVVLQSRENASPLVVTCEIVDYTAETISVQINSQSDVRRFPTADVTSVEAVQTEAHREAVRQFHAGQIVDAERLFEQALEEETRSWVRREILGWLVKSAMRRRDHAEAGSRFLQIIELESAPREYSLIPLVWGAAQVGTSLRQQARMWLTGEADVGRLLGASVLLLDPSYGEVTRNELRRLSRSSDRRVSALARAQLWRLRDTGSGPTTNELADRERDIESMPAEIRSGPYFVLATAAYQQGEYDRAAAAFLWLTTVYSENEPLTAQATLEAGRSLMRLGREAEARSLFQEVSRRFDWSLAAAEAKSLLDQLPASEGNRDAGASLHNGKCRMQNAHAQRHHRGLTMAHLPSLVCNRQCPRPLDGIEGVL